MNGYEFEAAALPWGPMEETMLLLAREQEWAEAYTAEHPECQLGRIYLGFLCSEMVRALGEL